MRDLARRMSEASSSPLVRHTGIYTLSNVASRAVPFLLLPILTRYLSPGDYGIVTMLLLLTALLDPVIGLGLSGWVSVRFFDRTIDLPAHLGSGLIAVTGLAAAGLIVVGLVATPLSLITSVPPTWLLIVVPLVLARTIANVFLALLRVSERPVTFAIAQNAQTAGLLVLAIVLVVGLAWSWQGRIVAEVAAWAGVAFAGLVWARRAGMVRGSLVTGHIRTIARFGLPLIPHSLGAVLLVQTDRLLLTNLVGVEATGVYAVAYQLAVVVELLAVSFNFAYAPWLFRTLRDADIDMRRRLVRMTYVQFGSMAALALGAAVLMPWVGDTVIDARFAAAGPIIGWFCLAFMFRGMYLMVTNYLFYAERTGWLSAVTLGVAVVNIPVTYLLITLNGPVGAAQATALALGLSFGLTWVVSQRAYPMPWLQALRER